MNPFILLTGIIVVALVTAIVLYCIGNGKLPHLLLACGILGGVGATWLGLRQLYLRSSADWKSVALVAIGLCVILASAVVSRRILALPRTEA